MAAGQAGDYDSSLPTGTRVEFGANTALRGDTIATTEKHTVQLSTITLIEDVFQSFCTDEHQTWLQHGAWVQGAV